MILRGEKNKTDPNTKFLPIFKGRSIKQKKRRHEANQKILVISNREGEVVDNSSSLIEINNLCFLGVFLMFYLSKHIGILMSQISHFYKRLSQVNN